jgi:DNA polymerase elongation subunit (family B)
VLNGYILDVYPDYRKNTMVVWLINDRGTVKIEEKYEPAFYVYAPSNDLYRLAVDLQDLSEVKKLNFTYGKTVLGSNKEKLVLEVTPRCFGSLSKLATLIDAQGGFQRYRLFNVDIRLSTRYLKDRGVFCNAWVGWDGRSFVLDDTQWALDYHVPSFKVAYLDVKCKVFNKPVTSIVVNDCVVEEENEVDTILSAARFVEKLDPDVIYTCGGDSVLFPFLYHRARVCGISLNLGRDQVQCLNPVKKAKSYFSYGRIIYRPAFYMLRGRVHIDTCSSFLYKEGGLRGLIDVSRCSCIPLQLLSRLAPGTAISQMQVNEAMERGYLIPWKKNIPESWKTALDLLISDRGGLILEPVVGLHEGVVELDFASLYPNIMFNFNISPETMLCRCCSDSPVRVPQLGYHICVRQRGLIPEVLKSVIYRRFCFKARSKNKNYNEDLYKGMQRVWKWILLVCFGYTGYRNARYGRIECHESITAFSRDILLTAMEIAEQAGYKVLHGIVDSLWVKPSKSSVELSVLCRRIGRRTGVKMDVEGCYRWIVFLPARATRVGALNRYYGLFDNGELKTRGIELRQHNTPVFLRNMQHEMLSVFSKAENSKEFLEMIPEAVETLCSYGERIVSGDVDHRDLVFTTYVSRDIGEYKVNNLVKSALLQLQDIDVRVEPGQCIRYIVTDERSRDYRRRVCVTELLTGMEKIDAGFYLRQVAQCGESLLIPFGYTFEKIKNMLEKKRVYVSVSP